MDTRRFFRGRRSSQHTGEPGSEDPHAHNPLGLRCLVEVTPEHRRATIVLVHGIGGGSNNTWSYVKKKESLWPQAWLPFENGLDNVQVMTYGYDASFVRWTPTLSGIEDFSASLLWELQLFLRKGEQTRLGKAPRIMFIAHSMGGLVVKQVKEFTA